MAGSAIKHVRNAVWAVLNADATLTSTLGASVHQSTPDNAASPYVTLGPDVEVSNNTFGKIRREVTLTTESWADDHDDQTAEDLADRVDDLLDFKSDLSVTGYTVVAIHHDGHETLRHDDQWRQVIGRYRVILEEA